LLLKLLQKTPLIWQFELAVDFKARFFTGTRWFV
jgi:hypothetical protein